LQLLFYLSYYGLATMSRLSRLLKMIRLFCRIPSLLESRELRAVAKKKRVAAVAKKKRV